MSTKRVSLVDRATTNHIDWSNWGEEYGLQIVAAGEGWAVFRRDGHTTIRISTEIRELIDDIVLSKAEGRMW